LQPVEADTPLYKLDAKGQQQAGREQRKENQDRVLETVYKVVKKLPEDKGVGEIHVHGMPAHVLHGHEPPLRYAAKAHYSQRDKYRGEGVNTTGTQVGNGTDGPPVEQWHRNYNGNPKNSQIPRINPSNHNVMLYEL